jgi:predicted GNAT family N-acyltransferase
MHNFVTNVEHRGEGHGTRLMHDVVAYADRTGQDIYAHARPELHDFYGRFGFETTGREAEDISNPDADLLPEIHRPAKR